uniref:Gamma interferon inducible lysosomal thiol reductase n=1 Tax=Plectus sambesii TaxID=2011161 RepID=A0A914X4N3_9BILA
MLLLFVSFVFIVSQHVTWGQLTRSKQVNVDVYVEAQCPFSTRFFANELMPFVRQFPHVMNLTIIPYGNTECHRIDGRVSCKCFHGPNECQLNQLMNCMIHRHPYIYDYLDTVVCIQGQPDLATAHRSCIAGKPDEWMLMKCARSRRGFRLHLKSGVKTLKTGVENVPWITVNGKYNKPSEYAFRREICGVSELC